MLKIVLYNMDTTRRLWLKDTLLACKIALYTTTMFYFQMYIFIYSCKQGEVFARYLF